MTLKTYTDIFFAPLIEGLPQMNRIFDLFSLSVLKYAMSLEDQS